MREILAKYDDGYVYSVDILYGPTKVCGVVKHRTGRVEHIKDKLEQRGFEVKLRRFSNYGKVAFAIEGQVVFTCDAKNLSFDGCSFRDPLTDKIIRKLLAERCHAITRATRTRIATTNVSNDEEHRCLRNPGAP